MTQFSNIEEEAGRLSQIIEQDIAALDQDTPNESGSIIAASYIDLITVRINQLFDSMPRLAIDSLPGETMKRLGDQIRKEVLEKINLELSEKSDLQMNNAIELLLEERGNTPEYLSLIREIADTRNRLLTVLLMQTV